MGAQSVPLVSVLMPVYNAQRWLAQALESVRDQTFTNWELIAIDDGSSDLSSDILRDFAQGDRRMGMVEHDQNCGIVPTRNALVRLARGEFIAWMDADDLMPPERLAMQLARFENEPKLVALGGACELIDPEDMPLCTFKFPESHEDVMAETEPSIPSLAAITMRREAVLAAGGFRDFFRIAEDLDLWLRLAEIGRVGNIPEIALRYRQHMASTCNTGRSMAPIFARRAREFAEERRRRGTDPLQRGEQVVAEANGRAHGANHRAETLRRWGWWALESGHVSTARRHAFRALRESPMERESWKLMACAVRGR